MRMWMVDPKLMCRQHLLGEHVELHMFVGHINKGRRLKGYIESNCIEPRKLINRHDEIVEEMLRRGYNHKTPLEPPTVGICMGELFAIVDKDKSADDLFSRCEECRKRKG